MTVTTVKTALPFKTYNFCFEFRYGGYKCWICSLDAAEAEKITIHRVSEEGIGKGFQRDIKPYKVNDIISDLESNEFLPYNAVYCALHKGEVECVDGQHRLVAHRDAGENVLVLIVEMDQDSAVKVFNRDNGFATRTSILDNIKTGREPKYKFMNTDLVGAYDISLNQAIALMSGLSAGGKIKNPSEPWSEEQKLSAQVILNIWTNSSNWAVIEKSSNARQVGGKRKPYSSVDAYSGKIILTALGKLSREHNYSTATTKKIVKLVQTADWKKDTGNSLRQMATETGSRGAKSMADFIGSQILACYI